MTEADISILRLMLSRRCKLDAGSMSRQELPDDDPRCLRLKASGFISYWYDFHGPGGCWVITTDGREFLAELERKEAA